MRLEWLRADQHTDTNWACFEIYDDGRAYVLAVIGPSETIDRAMTHAEARQLWRELVAKGWHHATADEIDEAMITRGYLLRVAYRRG